MKNVSVSKKVTRLLVTIIIVAVTLVMVIPFVWMLSASFKTEADVMKIPIEWIPKYFYIDNYKNPVKTYNFYNFNKISQKNVNTTCVFE